MNLRVSQNSGKFLSGCPIGGFSRRAQLHDDDEDDDDDDDVLLWFYHMLMLTTFPHAVV
jgi:hypothetical protein